MLDGDRVTGFVPRVRLLMLERIGDDVGYMLDERAPECHGQELLSATDAQHRPVALQCAERKRELGCGPRAVDGRG